jgi:hypothetical protein
VADATTGRVRHARADGPICLDNAVAHELGHMRLHHTIKRLALFVVVAAAVFVVTVAVWISLPEATLWRIGDVPFHAVPPGMGAVPRPGPNLRTARPAAVGRARDRVAPILVGFIRNQERDADLFGVRLTRDPLGFSLLLQRLALSNLADLEPTGIARLLFRDPRQHPRPHRLGPGGAVVAVGGSTAAEGCGRGADAVRGRLWPSRTSCRSVGLRTPRSIPIVCPSHLIRQVRRPLFSPVARIDSADPSGTVSVTSHGSATVSVCRPSGV